MPDPATLPERVAARVILTDRAGRVLLLHGRDPLDPSVGTWWFTAGGGLEPGEDLTRAARREVFEETGLRMPDDLGPVVLTRRAVFPFGGSWFHQVEHLFRVVLDLLDADPDHLDRSGWTAQERDAVHGFRWWTVEELRATPETIYPHDLADLVDPG